LRSHWSKGPSKRTRGFGCLANLNQVGCKAEIDAGRYYLGYNQCANNRQGFDVKEIARVTPWWQFSQSSAKGK